MKEAIAMIAAIKYDALLDSLLFQCIDITLCMTAVSTC